MVREWSNLVPTKLDKAAGSRGSDPERGMRCGWRLWGRGGRGGGYTYIKLQCHHQNSIIVQELYESRGGRPGLSVLTSLLDSEDVKLY